MIGSAYGDLFARFAGSIPLIESASASSYSMVGMGALVSATTHAPMTAILLLFEMTRNYLIIVPLLISCIVSYYVSYRLDQTNIYTRKLTKQGISILAGKETNLLQSIPIKEAMVTEVDCLEESAGLDHIRELFEKTHHTHYPVVDENRRVIGLVDYVENWDLLTDDESLDVLVARDLARTPAVTIKKNETLLEALRKITDLHVELLPVVNDDDQLEGVLSRNDIINTYNRKLRESS